MTYHELMQKIKELPGVVFELKFGDRVFYFNDEWIVQEIIDNQARCINRWGAWLLIDIDKLIPLPTVEQWDEAFKAKSQDLEVHRIRSTYHVYSRSWSYGEVESVDPKTNPCIACAILYARVVLGYKLVDGEFVKPEYRKGNADERATNII